MQRQSLLPRLASSTTGLLSCTRCWLSVLDAIWSDAPVSSLPLVMLSSSLGLSLLCSHLRIRELSQWTLSAILKALINASSELPSLVSVCFLPIRAVVLSAITLAKGDLRVGQASYYRLNNWSIPQWQKYIKELELSSFLKIM